MHVAFMLNPKSSVYFAHKAQEGSSSDPHSPSYMESHDLVYAKDRRRSKVKTHREVEAVLRIHCWEPTTTSPVNGWMDYSYNPPTSRQEIQPVASLPTPSLLPNMDELVEEKMHFPPPASDDWKLAFFPATLQTVQQFATRVNEVTGDEILVVQEKPFHWMKVMTGEVEDKQEQKQSL